MAVVASSLMGMISGSATANVATIGSIHKAAHLLGNIKAVIKFSSSPTGVRLASGRDFFESIFFGVAGNGIAVSCNVFILVFGLRSDLTRFYS